VRRNVLTLNSLCKRLGAVRALRGVTLSASEGETVVFTGPNGAGKTTLLRCIAGLLAPDSGSLEVHGFSPAAEPNTRSPRVRMGVMLEQPMLYAGLSVAENMLLFSSLSGVKNPGMRAVEVLKKLELDYVSDRLVRECSSGMRQRASFARAILSDPELIVLDEPFVHLDSKGRSLMLEALIRCKDRGACILIATHVEAEVERIADRLIRLNHGQIASDRQHGSEAQAQVTERGLR